MTNRFERPMEINRIESVTDDVATVLTGKPLPPGSRISFMVNGATIHGKVVAIKKNVEGEFSVNVRLNSLTRSDKIALDDVL